MRQRTIVCPIIQNDGAYLLCKMADDRGVFPGQWALCGGGMEPGETMEQALRREVREELGDALDIIDVKPWAFRDDIRVKTYADGTTEEIYMIYLIFDCISANRDVTFNDEFQEIAWVYPESLRELDLNEATRITFAQRAFFNRPLPRRFTGPRSENFNKCADAVVSARERNPPHRLPRRQPLHRLHDARQLAPVDEVHPRLRAKPPVECTYAHPGTAGMAFHRLIIIDGLQQFPDHIFQPGIGRYGQIKADLRRQSQLFQQQDELSGIVFTPGNA